MIKKRDYSNLSSHVIFLTNEIVHVEVNEDPGRETQMAVLSRILRPDAGSVLLDDKDLYTLSDTELSNVHQRKIGYVPQANIFLKQYNVLDNIVLPYLSGEKGAESELIEKAKEHLEKLGIGDLWDRFPYELSGGEQKRVALIRALLMQPQIMIADEPTTGLDTETGMIILSNLAEYVKCGHSVLVATHDDHVKEYADRIIDIKKVNGLEMGSDVIS